MGARSPRGSDDVSFDATRWSRSRPPPGRLVGWSSERCPGARSTPRTSRRSGRPGRSTSSSWEPSSMMRPSSTTAMRSARIAVDRRWATMIAVRPSSTASRPASTWVSDLRSRFDVASSSTSTRGDARNARASAMSCRSPDDSDTPRSCTGVSTPSGSRSMSSVSPTRCDRLGHLVVGRRRAGRTRCCRAWCPRTGTAPGARRRAGGAASRW